MFDFGERLKNLRKENNWTQERLANKIGLSKTVISKYENNIQMPTLDTLIKMAVLFNVSMDYIAGIEKNQTMSLIGLSPEQSEIIHELSKIFVKKENIRKSNFNSKEYEIIGKIIVELFKTTTNEQIYRKL